MTVFSSSAEHFERLSSGLIPGLDLRLVWVGTLAVYAPLQHMICLSTHLRIQKKHLQRLFTALALDDNADSSI